MEDLLRSLTNLVLAMNGEPEPHGAMPIVAIAVRLDEMAARLRLQNGVQ